MPQITLSVGGHRPSKSVDDNPIQKAREWVQERYNGNSSEYELEGDGKKIGSVIISGSNFFPAMRIPITRE